MFIILKISLTMIIIVTLLRKRVSIGNAMSVGALAIWAMTAPDIAIIITSVTNTIKNATTWEIVLALYFVMCLEHQLRTSGTLDKFMASLQHIVPNDKLTIAIMPAVLGFLPSLGGALFSCPMVENISQHFHITPEKKTTINYWFRHIFEYTNPINPGILLASGIALVPLGSLVWQMSWLTVLMFFVGWIVLLTNLEPKDEPSLPENKAGFWKRSGYIFLTLGPIIANFLLIVCLHLRASLSMALVTGTMVFVLHQKPAAIKEMLIAALDKKLLWGIFGILIFQQVLLTTGTINAIVHFFKQSNLPIPWIVGIISFIVGLLTGTSQGNAAIAFPIAAALAPGDINIAVIAYTLGLAGQMITPTHLCMLVTMDYFKSEFMKTLKPVLFMEALMVISFLVVKSCF